MSETPEDPTGIRYYGGDGTVHGNGEVNVELDRWGRVVAVWFRCQPLPFTQNVVQDSRAENLRGMYESQPPIIDAIVLREEKA
jgi:hypothetical protein